MTLMNPGPATSTVAFPARFAAATTSSATSRGLRPSCLGEGERAVGLGVGAVARPHHRIHARRGTGDSGKRRCQQVGDDDEGISHEESIVLVPIIVRHAGFAGPCTTRRGLVAILRGIPPS